MAFKKIRCTGEKPYIPAGYRLDCAGSEWRLTPTTETRNKVNVLNNANGYSDFIYVKGMVVDESTVLKQAEKTANSTLLSRSVYKIVDLIGEGPISGFYYNTGTYGSDPLTSTYFDGVRVRNFDGSYNFNLKGLEGATGTTSFEFNYTVGETGQSGVPGYLKVENFVPLPSNTRVAKMPPKHGVQKDVVATILKKDYPDIEGIKLTVKTPSLFRVDDEGSNKGGYIRYSVYARIDNEPEVNILPTRPLSIWNDSIKKREIQYLKQKTIAGIANSTYLDTEIIYNDIFTKNWKQISIRVERNSENIISNRVQNELYVESIAVIGSNKYSYPSTALTAMVFNSDQFGQVPVRSYDIMGLLLNVPDGYSPPFKNVSGSYSPAVYPSIWMGNFAAQPKWSNNPAWVFYDILTNKRYGLGDYFNNDWIDKWSLYEIARYCDELVDDGNGGLEPRFACNAVIQERKDAYELIQDLSSCFQGMTYWANGRIFANTSKNYPSVYSFTNANVIDGKFLYSDTAKNTRSTVVKVKWNDPDALFKEDVVKIEDVDGILKYGYIEKEIAAFGCTSRGQATRIANWVLETERILTETITFQTALEGVYLRPGDNFDVYDNFVNNKSQGGRIIRLDNSLTGAFLDRPVNLELGKSYELSVVCPRASVDDFTQITGSNQVSGIRPPQISTRTVYSLPGSGLDFIGVSPAFDTGIQNGAVWLLSSTTSGSLPQDQSRQFRCLATAEVEKGIVEILGVENNTGIVYRASTGYYANGFPSIPVVKASILPPSGLTVSIASGIELGKFYYNYSLNWSGSPSTNLSNYNISGRISGSDYFTVAQTEDNSYFGDFSSSGFYEFRVGAISDEGVHSSYITGGINFSLTNNPLGGPVGISGVKVANDVDESLGLTGYVGTDFNFSWEIEDGESGYYSAKTAFFSGYKVNVLNPDTNVSVLEYTENQLEGRIYGVGRDDLTGLGLPGRRDVKIRLTSYDTFGGVTSPVDTVFYNSPPRSPASSGFQQFIGGLQYNVVGNPNDTDISGLYLWTNVSNSFTPTFNNKDYSSEYLNGFYPNSFSETFYCWFSLIDTFGETGCPIYGPLTINPGYSVVTGIRAHQNPFLANGVTLSGFGGVTLTQNGQSILISGERPAFNLGFFLDTVPDETGIAVGELISSKGFVFTGYAVSCRTTSSANLSGNFYYCDYDNTNRVNLGQYGLVAGQTATTQTLSPVVVPAAKKVGYDITNIPTDAAKLSIGLFGYDVK